MAGVPAVKGEIFYLQVMLTSQADTDIFKVDPTIVAGDLKVSTDYAGLVNVDGYFTTLGSAEVRIQLSPAQMNGDIIGVYCHDQAGAEWQDLYVEIRTDSQQIGDIPTAATIATAVWAAGTRTLTSYGTLVADTAAAVWAYATRTLTSISGVASDIWSYATRTLTQSATQVTAAVSGSDITVNSYNTWTIALTGVGDISSRTALYFTAKKNPEDDPDTASIVQVEETDGLLYINGAAGTAAHGSITVTDATAGDLTIVVSASATGIPRQSGQYAVKMVTDSDVQYMAAGSFQVEAEAGRAIA